LIIVSSAFATRLARTREAVYFRILGGTGSFIVRVFTLENMLLGLLCAGQAALIAQLGSFAVCHKFFDIPYRAFAGTTLGLAALTVMLITVAGASGSLSVLRQKPLPFLREENQE
jgi:putative ABC transport system permease protein